jgi:hypothetical protein
MMDYNSFQLDNPIFKQKVNEFIDNTSTMLEKRTLTIYKELTTLKDDYYTIVKSCKYF